MTTLTIYLRNGLEDIMGDLRFARRWGDMGRLALLDYCEVQRWASPSQDAGTGELFIRADAELSFSQPRRVLCSGRHSTTGLGATCLLQGGCFKRGYD